MPPLATAQSLDNDEISVGDESFCYAESSSSPEEAKKSVRIDLEQNDERQRQASVCNAADLAHVAAHCTAGCAEFALGMAACDEDAVYNADDLLDKNRDDEDEALIKQALSMRPVLSLCCWDFGLSCFKSFR
eukprot:scaffold11053_cov178-Amphora_coffeaeformis.AAC.5